MTFLLHICRINTSEQCLTLMQYTSYRTDLLAAPSIQAIFQAALAQDCILQEKSVNRVPV